MVPTALTRPFYGVLLAPTLILATYADTHTSPDHLWRPLVVTTLVALLLFGLLGLTRRWHLAALITAMAVLGLVGVYPVLAVLVVVAMVVTLQATRRLGWYAFERLTQPLNVIVSLWFAMTLAVAVLASLPAAQPDSDPLEVRAGPNVYLVLLDGYMRADSLMEYFGYDNRPFLDALEERAFSVSVHARSRYTQTAQVVPTLFHHQPLDAVLNGEWEGTNAQYRFMQQLINNSPTQAAFEAAGYETYSIVSGATGLDWRTADHVYESPWPSTFERHLLNEGILRPVVPFDAMHRASILDAFHFLKDSAGSSPRFVFAHVMSPHYPYVFDADGSPAVPCQAECANYVGPPTPTLADRLTGQVTYLNQLVLDAVDHIAAVDPDGVVIVFSDHGLRRDPADPDEWTRTLLAARNVAYADDAVVMDLLVNATATR